MTAATSLSTTVTRGSAPRGLARSCEPQQPGRGARILYGDLRHVGVDLRWHDIPATDTFDWHRNLGKETLVLCLNLLGQGEVRGGDTTLQLETGTAGLFFTGNGACQAIRQPSQAHQFLTLECTATFLRRYLSSCDGALHPAVEGFLTGNTQRAAQCGQAQRMTGELASSARRMGQPAVFQRARDLWYQGKVLQLMAEYLFERQGEDELFCDRQKRLAQERAQKVIAILQRDLISPPALEAIGREVGCSPFHLSRTFSQQAGMTIPQYVRKLRIERAAELLQSGKHNVTEAALEVGYSSLSHFSQAFCQIMGCCPGLYPLKPQPGVKK